MLVDRRSYVAFFREAISPCWYPDPSASLSVLLTQAERSQLSRISQQPPMLFAMPDFAVSVLKIKHC